MRGLLFALSAPLLGASAVTLRDYAPDTHVPCPLDRSTVVRSFTPQNASLNPAESTYVQGRLAGPVAQGWKDWLGDGAKVGYDMGQLDGKWPTVGLALGGEGLRAAQFGAGVLGALDGRDDGAKSAGTGGLLQVAAYIAGLSGGSWTTVSATANDWPSMSDLVNGDGEHKPGWMLDMDLVTPNGFSLNDENTQTFYNAILESVVLKANSTIVDKGHVSLTDVWSRMLSYHFLNNTARGNFFNTKTAHGAGQRWSGVTQTKSWQSALAPFPIIKASSRKSGSNATGLLSKDEVVYEMTPYEFGSWDPSLGAMINMTFAGSHRTNNDLDLNGFCVQGFDQIGFVMGTSSSFFNSYLNEAKDALNDFDVQDSQAIVYLMKQLLNTTQPHSIDAANWPNPFQNLKPDTFQDTNSTYLELVDGSFDRESVPVSQLLSKPRGVDFVLAADASADTPDGLNWPNASALFAAKDRLESVLKDSHRPLPPMPKDAQAVVDQGLNLRPTFFGCEPTNQQEPEWPLVVYMPNAPPLKGEAPVVNTPITQLAYSRKHSRLFFNQTFMTATSGFVKGSSDRDSNFGTCLQCAAADRARLKAGMGRSDQCTKCFQQYCYDETKLTSRNDLPGRVFKFNNPEPSAKGMAADHRNAIIGGVSGAVGLVVILGGFFFYRKRRAARQKRGSYQKVQELHADFSRDADSRLSRFTASRMSQYADLDEFGRPLSSASSNFDAPRPPTYLRPSSQLSNYDRPSSGYAAHGRSTSEVFERSHLRQASLPLEPGAAGSPRLPDIRPGSRMSEFDAYELGDRTPPLASGSGSGRGSRNASPIPPPSQIGVGGSNSPYRDPYGDHWKLAKDMGKERSTSSLSQNRV